jgi:flagellar P-ring protein precursor FlgI
MGLREARLKFVQLVLMLLVVATPAFGARAKDLGRFYGVRDVQLTGVGLVTGLQQTGDTQINRATARVVLARLAGLGHSFSESDLMARNAALVSITATMSSDARIGNRVDVQVASTGDARSLEGGVLQPALLGTLSSLDEVYVVAQGPLTVGGYNVESDGNQTRKNVTNVGLVSGGGIVEREVDLGVDYATLDSIDFLLDADHSDFTTALRLADAVNLAFGEDIADPVSGTTIRVRIPDAFKGRFGRFAAQLEQVEVEPDTISRVVIDARTGTVVLGGSVSVRPFAIAHGGMKIEVQVQRTASQPGAFSRTGETVIVENTFIGVDEEKGELVLVNAVSLADLVTALNTMGVKPRDLVVILQAIKDAGALDADLVTR